MNKLYYIVCEEKDTTLFEGRFQGRTRGAALRFLKQSIGHKSLGGLVFTITEIPVPLIREIVAEILAGGDGATVRAAPVIPPPADEPEDKVVRFDAFSEAAPDEPDEPEAEPEPGGKVGNPGHGDELWSRVRASWEKSRNLRKAAAEFGLSPNTVKTRARREGWGK